MSVPYDLFTGAFLSKVTEYDFLKLSEYDRHNEIDGYMKRAIAQFKQVCHYDMTTTQDDLIRCFDLDIPQGDLDELVDIVTEGMVVQWMKPYVYKADNLENVLNTRDFTSYSPAELLLRITNAYRMAKKDFDGMIKEYSYNHGDLEGLSL